MDRIHFSFKFPRESLELKVLETSGLGSFRNVGIWELWKLKFWELENCAYCTYIITAYIYMYVSPSLSPRRLLLLDSCTCTTNNFLIFTNILYNLSTNNFNNFSLLIMGA